LGIFFRVCENNRWLFEGTCWAQC